MHVFFKHLLSPVPCAEDPLKKNTSCTADQSMQSPSIIFFDPCGNPES